MYWFKVVPVWWGFGSPGLPVWFTKRLGGVEGGGRRGWLSGDEVMKLTSFFFFPCVLENK